MTSQQQPPIRVAIVSFLFNWPSTGGGIVHTVELADFLGRAGYTVRHIYARNLAWGIGRVTQAVPFDSLALDFDQADFHAETIQQRFRAAVREFDPDYVIVTDSWNFKPLLADAVREFPYFLRLQASECLCPLNNLRFLPSGEQCGNHQLADAQRCRACVERCSANSGGLHQAERALVGFGTARYDETLRRAFAEAEAVLVVNELAAAMVGPYSRTVRVVTSGFDPARFPWSEHDPPPEKTGGSKLQIFMAGLVEDRIKGFHVLDAACKQLWRKRRDFELLVTGDPPGQVNEYTRNVGWLTQLALPERMRGADIVVVPTVAQDALGRTAVEAMAAARPVVASRIGGLPYTISDGAGLLFEPGDAADLANKLELLFDDPKLRRTMGALGRRRFEQHFTWQSIIDKHYRPLLANRRVRGRVGQGRLGDHRPTVVGANSPANPTAHGGPSLASSLGPPYGVAPRQKSYRVALIYDDERRPETTGVYCRRALEGLAEVEFFRPSQLASIQRDKFDLFLNIDDGLRYRLPDDLRPSAWWCIDTHIEFAWSLEKARDFDLVFAAQRDGAERLRANGITSAQWLPLACDPEVHGGQMRAKGDGYVLPERPEGCFAQNEPVPFCPRSGSRSPKQYDICFVGNLIPGRRTDLLRLIQQHFDNVFVGLAYFDDMARIYAASRIVFNCSVANDLNMRVFEALASGSLLMTNELKENGLSDLFRDGIHLATYRDGHELIDKLRYYLKRDDVRERIATAGRAEVLAKHTYRLRMEEVLSRAQGRGNREEATSKAKLAAPTPALPRRERETLNAAPVPYYYDFARPELLALVPPSAKRVLEVGCGAGRLGESIKARQNCHVTGIELDERAAEAARQRLDRVITGDIESLDLDFQAGNFDCVICGDVLEHLRQPEHLLQRMHAWLVPDGVLVASIPNTAHRSVIANLLRGDWEYEPAGLLDNTHLRFFTRRSIERLLYRAHFDLRALQAAPGPGDDEWWRSEKHADAQIGPLRAQGLNRQQAEELHTYQYLLTAKAAPVPDDGLTSIVILTHNEWAYTERCLESIRFRTDEPYELIVVDNGSTDGTPERLRGMRDVRLIANAENHGFPAGVNQGIAAAGGRQILLLNNDVIVSTGWLRRMLHAMQTSVVSGQLSVATDDGQRTTGKIGMVGPLTNAASGQQQIAAGYSGLDQLDAFAWEHGKAHAGQLRKVDRLVGFCLLIRREVIDEVGLFDERFGVGNYEDDDYCHRARAAGWRLAVAQDAFIHHFGHRTFDGAGVDLNALLEENKRIYDEKWSGVESGADGPHPSHPPVGEGAKTEDQRPKTLSLNPKSNIENPKSPALSLCMIVRDNERTIRAALESIRPWVDEMIAVDTGSQDATPDICRELGAKVYHFPWPDSFSVARNESLKHARGEWIFWMDSDDVIDAENGCKLRELVAELVRVPASGAAGPNSHESGYTMEEQSSKTQDQSPKTSSHNPKPKIENPKSPLGFVMQVHCPGPGDDGGHNLTVVDHVKLFRNLPELRFEGRIHEQVLPSIRRLGGEVEFTDIFVVHAGADHSPETRRRKLKRDFHLLKLELAEQPDHPFTLFNLGMTYADAGRHRRAVRLLRSSLAKSDPAQSQVRKAYALLAGSYLQLGKLRAARRVCRQGLKHFPNDPELLFRAGLVAHRLQKLDEAERNYLAALANRDQRHFSSIDRGIVGFKARQNLAAVYTDKRDLRRAEDEWRKIVAEVSGYRDGWIGLVENLLEQSRLADAAGVAAELDVICSAGVSPAHDCGAGVSPAPRGLIAARLIVRAKLAEARGDRPAALAALREVLELDPADVLARDMLCRLLFTGGETAAAAVELARLVELDAANAAAQHNLGIARLRLGDFAGAARSLETSLRLRPQYAPSHHALAHARRMLNVGQAFQPDAAVTADGDPRFATNRRQAGKPDLQEAQR